MRVRSEQKGSIETGQVQSCEHEACRDVWNIQSVVYDQIVSLEEASDVNHLQDVCKVH